MASQKAIEATKWALAAILPLVLYLLSEIYSRSIGCPPRGDCYVEGFVYVYALLALALGAALFLWPLTLYKVIRILFAPRKT